MTESRLVQLVPALPPPEEGVGNFALTLGGALAERGFHGRCLAAAALPARRPDELAAALAAERTVLLHYVNYGYQRRGCPGWLVEALTRWKAAAPSRRLITMFHEVHASGPPWRSSFWLRPRQRQLAARLLRLSDAAVTSLDRYAGILRRWRRDVAIDVRPVFSTVGEPAAVPPLAERPRRLLLFGGAGVRRRAWEGRQAELLAACRGLEIEEVWDAGPPAGAPARLDGSRVRQLGVLPAAEISARLLDVVAGFTAYPPGFLGKSTAFAAYCAHGVLPVCAWRNGEASGPPPHWSPRRPAPVDPQAVADAARAWYAEHSLARQAAAFAERLRA
ncbi:MAG TPA: glycosyltransferase family 1 protein [Thermoanaerobaculia bacterium]|nr:glycosyltransferase family 1 protein [Thermoanaerobaculia bacterium]